MKLPNPHHAVVDVDKLREYCLSMEHPRGRHKARVFEAALGLTAKDAEELRETLLMVAITQEAVPAEADEYGQRFILDFEINRPAGRAKIRSLWMVRRGEDFPRLTSCYVL